MRTATDESAEAQTGWGLFARKEGETVYDTSPPSTGVQFDAQERLSIRQFSSKSRAVRVFTLLLRVADAAIRRGIESQWLETEEIVSDTRFMKHEYRRVIETCFFTARDLGLLLKREVILDGHQRCSLWALSADGKTFLMGAIRARVNMRKISNLSDEEICADLAQDEVEQWRQDARDRAEFYTRANGKHSLPRRSKRPDSMITRSEFVHRLIAVNTGKAVAAQALVSPIWAGLIRE